MDFKTRLILGKTQFNASLAHWTNDNVSQNCKSFMEYGDYESATLLHMLYTCPTANAIICYICDNLTHQEDITPVSVILTNT